MEIHSNYSEEKDDIALGSRQEQEHIAEKPTGAFVFIIKYRDRTLERFSLGRWQLQADLWQFHEDPQYQPVGRSLSPLWGRGADDAWGLEISSFLDAFKDNSKFIFIHMFTSLNLYRRALLCPHLIQCINNAFKLSKTMSVFYFHQSPASSMVWSPLCPVCVTRTEHCNSLLSFPLSICLSCSQITFGFCSHTEDSQPLWSPPSLCTLQRNQDHKLGRDLTMESGFHGMQMDSLSTLATKAVQAWNFSLLFPLSLFLFFITVCYFPFCSFCRILL